jgi:hypothetical protein
VPQRVVTPDGKLAEVRAAISCHVQHACWLLRCFAYAMACLSVAGHRRPAAGPDQQAVTGLLSIQG